MIEAKWIRGLCAAAFLLVSAAVFAQSPYTSIQSGDWNDDNTWSGTGIPGAGDSATITSSHTVTVTALQNAGQVVLQNGSGSRTLRLSTGGSLTIDGTGTALQVNSSTDGVNTVELDGGSLLTTAGEVRLNTPSLGLARINFTINGGTLTSATDVTFGGITINDQIVFAAGSPGVLEIGGDLGSGGNLITNNSGTFRFNGTGSQTINGYAFKHLEINKVASTATMNAAITVNGNLTINNGVLDDGGYQISLDGTGGSNVAIGATGVLKLGSAATDTTFPSPYNPINVNLAPGSAIVYQSGQAGQSIETTFDYQRLYLLTLGGAVVRNFVNQAFDGIQVLQEFNIGTNVTASFDNDVLDVDGDIAGTGTIELLNSVSPGNVTVAGDWDNGVSLVANNGTTVTYDGTGSQNIAGVNYKNLTINKTAGTASVTAGASVLQNLNLTSGNVDVIGSFFVDVNATVTRISGHFLGPLTMGMNTGTPRRFHVGTSTSYVPVDAEGGSAGTLILEAVDGQHPNKTGVNALDRYWRIGASSSVSSITSITFNYNVSDLTFGDEMKYVLSQYNGGIWTQFPGDLVDEVLHTATKTSFGGYAGDWVVGQRGSNGAAGKIAITSVNNSNPLVANTAFPVDVETQHDDGSPANVAINTGVDILLDTGTGSFMGGFGTVNAGTSTATVASSTYDTVESGVILAADAVSGETQIEDGFSSALTFVAGGSFVVTNLLSTGAGSLRDAINAANGGVVCPSPCTITFDPSGTGIIPLTSALPPITADFTTIDGYTASGASANTNATFGTASDAVIPVILDGQNSAAVGVGIEIQGNGVTISGLGFKGFNSGGAGEAIKINNTSGNKITGCFIGTDGTFATPNWFGIVINGAGATGNEIGGSTTDKLNVISGNTSWGIVLLNGASSNTIRTNYIGVTADDTTGLGNGNGGIVVCTTCTSNSIGTSNFSNVISGHAGVGIQVSGTMTTIEANFIGLDGLGSTMIPNGQGIVIDGVDNYVGGLAIGDRNHIAGNTSVGILIGSDDNEISNNYIGIDKFNAAAGNGSHGIQLTATAADNKIGFPSPNTIAYNAGRGIQLATTGIGNVMRTNSIRDNTNIAIDLSGDGATANDPTDTDTGANNRQNFPNPVSAVVNGPNVDVKVSINSSGGVGVGGFLIDIYEADTSATPQAASYIGTSGCLAGSVLTNMIVTVPAGVLTVGSKIVTTATAFTDGTCTTVSEGTSELSPGAIVGGDIHWSNASGGSWETPGNWNPAVVPGASDNVFIDAVGTYTVTMGASHSVNQFTVGIAGGTQNLDITGPNTLFITSPSVINATGIVTLNNTSNLTGTGGLDVFGTLNWNGGNISGVAGLNVKAGAMLNINNSTTKTLADRLLTIDFGGTVNWNDGNLNLQTGGAISNSGLFLITSNWVLNNAGGGGAFTNNGGATLRKNTSGGTAVFTGVNLNHNGGNLDIQLGTLDLAGATLASQVSISATAELLVNSDVVVINTGTSFPGTGTVRINGGTLTADTNVNIPTLVEDAGTLNGSGTLTSNSLTWNNGSMSGTGTTQVLGGSTMTIATSNPKLLQRSLVNDLSGLVTVSGDGTISIPAGGGITNNGLFDVTTDMTISGASTTITNGGTFRKSAGAGSLALTTTFDNTNTLDVLSGTVAIGFGSSNALFQAAGTCTVQISGSYTFNTGASLTGLGKLAITTGTLTINGSPNTVSNFQQTAGLLNGPGQLQVLTTGDWSGGTMAGVGGSTLASGSFTIGGAIGKTLNQRTFSVGAASVVTMNGTGALSMQNGGNISNAGAFNVTVNATFSNGGSAGIFDNTGTFTKSGTTGTTSFTGVGFTNHNTVDLQTGILSVTGPFTQTSGTTKLLFGGTTPGTQFSQLQTGPNPTLNANLQVLLNGPYQPNPGDTFRAVQIATGTHTGTFTPNYPALAGGNTWSEAYDANGILLTVVGVADLTISKSAPSNVTSGSPISYTLTVNNTGPDPAVGVSVTDVLQPGHTFTSAGGGATWSCNEVSLTVTCTATSNLPTGLAPAITINANAPTATGPFTNVANVNSTNDPNGGNNSGSAIVTVDPPSADLSVAANAAPSPAPTATPVSYTFTITNNGPSSATGVTFAAPVPAGLTFTSSVPAPATCIFSANTLQCNLGTILNGSNTTVTINATTSAGGTQTITGTASRIETDPNAANDSASASVQVTAGSTLTVINTNDSGSGSLRQAIADANNGTCTAPCTINFNIPGGPPFTIAPVVTDLPALTSNTTIDATTQPGYAGSPIVKIDGTNTRSNGMAFATNNAVIRGLSITRHTSNAIIVTGNFNTVDGCWIGLDPAGVVEPNANGISINGNNNLIGGSTVPKRNVISGNTGVGVKLHLASNGNSVEGNFIGTNSGGTTPAGNNIGVQIADNADGNSIGGPTAAQRNVISGNAVGVEIQGTGGAVRCDNNIIRFNRIGVDAGSGITAIPNTIAGLHILGAATITDIADNVISGNGKGLSIAGPNTDGTVIQDNLIGIGADGTTAVPNTNEGVAIASLSTNTLVGGRSGGTNFIANNGADGLTVFGNTASIHGNSIFNNTQQGIDIDNDGVTANDLTDADTGSNNKQNFPNLTLAALAGANLTVNYNINSSGTAAQSLLLEFYRADGNGEGRDFLAEICLVGNSFTAGTTFPAGPVIVGNTIVATATSFSDTGCNTVLDGTSEFTQTPIVVTNCTPPNATITPAPPTVCALSTGNAASVPVTPGATYSWGISNGTITSATNGPSVTYTAGSTGAVNLSVIVTDSIGCTNSSNTNVTITPPPAVTITGPTASCPGAPITLDAGPGFASYSWSTGAFTQQISVSPTVGTTYSVTVTDVSGCAGTDSHTVTMHPVPAPTITGPTATCASTPVILDAGPGFTSYLWSPGGQLSQQITVNPGSTTNYSVTVTNASGCSGSDSHTVTVSANPAATISATAPACASSTGNAASVATQAGATYLWTIGNGTITSGQGTNAIAYTAGASGTVNLGVTVTVGSCVSNGSSNVTIVPAPVVNITGPTQVCPSTTFVLDAGAGFSSYLWSNGATSQMITVAQAAPSTIYSVSVSNGSCSTTDTHTVTLFPTPSVAITAPANALPDASGLVASVPLTAGATYNWTISNGTITSATNGNSITFTAGSTGTTTLNLTATSGSCSALAQHLVGITSAANDQADLGITKSAVASVQAGGTLVYTIGVTNAGPDNAADVLIVDTLPAGTTFVSVDDGPWNCFAVLSHVNCTGAAFLGDNTFITITVTAPQQAGAITNTVSISSTIPDPSSSNDNASATTNVIGAPATCATVPPSLIAPASNASVSSPVGFSWSAVEGAVEYELWIVTNNLTFLADTTTSTSLTRPLGSGLTSWFVVARLRTGCSPLRSSQRTFTVLEGTNCSTQGAPQLSSPAASSTVASPVTFSWTPVPQALGYRVWIEVNGTAAEDIGTTDGAISLAATVPPGSIVAFVDALFSGCPATRSPSVAFTVSRPDPCATRSAAGPFAPANDSTITSSSVDFQWSPANRADGYRVWFSQDGATPAVLGTTTNETSLNATFGPGVVVWWIESLYEGCASTESTRLRFTIPQGQGCSTASPTTITPQNGSTAANGEVTFTWTSVPGAISYELWLSAAEGIPTLAGTTNGTSLTRILAPGQYEWFVRVTVNRCPPRDSQTAQFSLQLPANCLSNQRPIAISPIEGADLSSPVDFSWHAPAGATSFELFTVRGNGVPQFVSSTTSTQILGVNLATGNLRWFVRAHFNNCAPLDSEERDLEVVAAPNACAPLAAPLINAPGQISIGVPFIIQWTPIAGATVYQLQLSGDPGFSSAETITTTATQHQLTRSSTVYARVRAIDGNCQPVPTITPFGPSAAIFILPQQGSEGATPLTGGIVTFTLPIGAQFAGQTFTATTHDPWLTVSPASGIVAPGGTNLIVTANTTGLPVGSSLGAVTLTLNSPSSGNVQSQGTTVTIPTFNISLVTPVTPSPKTGPPPDALVIPAVAHADGINSKFQSDVRVSNTSPQLIKYQLTFTPSGGNGLSAGKQTTFSIEPGRTVALDDILKSWFGTGSVSTIGTLEIRPITQTTTSTSSASLAGLTNLVTFAASRTFNLTSNGTFGQYIPAVPYSNFVGRSLDLSKPTILSLQQIAQSDRYRTNLGIVEGSGEAASLLVKVFGDSGQKLTEFPINLAGGEHTQLNGFLSQHGITSLGDGRVEIQVTSIGGKVTAYASVLDSLTSDPLLVTPVTLTDAGSTRWVVPGVADLNNGFANWQTDMRVFNAGSSNVDATLSFYSQNGGAAKTKIVTIPAGQVLQFDKTLSSVFGVSNDGGAVHITTASSARLITTARTYNQTTGGTYGQFISAVTTAEAAGVGSRPLQILQVEESNRFRSNIGLAEVTGNPVKIEISVVPPDAKFTAVTQLTLQANEFRQIGSLLKTVGLDGTFNARVTVRAIEGTGRVTAYASVIDALTNDPTYVPAQ